MSDKLEDDIMTHDVILGLVAALEGGFNSLATTTDPEDDDFFEDVVWITRRVLLFLSNYAKKLSRTQSENVIPTIRGGTLIMMSRGFNFRTKDLSDRF